MVCCLLTLVGYHKETVSVRLFCQLIQIGAFTYQLSDDVQVVAGDSFTHRTLFNECADDFAFSLLAASAPLHEFGVSLKRRLQGSWKK